MTHPESDEETYFESAEGVEISKERAIKKSAGTGCKRRATLRNFWPTAETERPIKRPASLNGSATSLWTGPVWPNFAWMVTLLAVLCLLQLLHPHLVGNGTGAEKPVLVAWMIEAASFICLLAALKRAVTVCRNLIGLGYQR